MKKYNCYTCGAFLKIHEYEHIEDGEVIESFDLVCNNKKCKDYGKHHVDNIINEN